MVRYAHDHEEQLLLVHQVQQRVDQRLPLALREHVEVLQHDDGGHPVLPAVREEVLEVLQGQVHVGVFLVTHHELVGHVHERLVVRELRRARHARGVVLQLGEAASVGGDGLVFVGVYTDLDQQQDLVPGVADDNQGRAELVLEGVVERLLHLRVLLFEVEQAAGARHALEEMGFAGLQVADELVIVCPNGVHASSAAQSTVNWG
eukprot:CAMPEP_0173202378 /NCGR_PEP_ID=MMETSP1141-20130122/18934_1 /TAXON_ID=483371 /ORGANISM="non described non described, Strain CCMP2298" /LENGTH=204 /DNA_ID=CAMNT_0014127725 /DNA_START=67 /DNA_END=681 /DNA_ORIENTATION=+